MNLNKYFVTLFGVLLGFVLLGSTVCAQDSRLYITVPAKAGSAKSGGAIGPLQNGQVYCSYEEGSRPKLYLENAQEECVWEVHTESGNVSIINQYGQYNDTIQISIQTNGNQLSTVTVSVKEGASYRKDLAIVIPRRARKAGEIMVDDLIGNDTTYCANLEYNVRVAEDPDFTATTDNYGNSGTYPSAQLRYRWTLRDNNGVVASELLESAPGMYSWKYAVPDGATAWVVQPKTCENVNTVTDPTQLRIINVIPENLTNKALSVRAIRYAEKIMNEKGEEAPGWDTVENDNYKNACVWYSKPVGDRTTDDKGTHLGYMESKAGFVYLQAIPYLPEDISFRHYQYEWIFDTADLILDTARMKTDSRMSTNGFGPDMPRVCFKVKKGKDKEIKVSYRMHCVPCNNLAIRQGKPNRYRSVDAESITLTRIDTLVDDKIKYSNQILDKIGDPVQVLDELPRLCGLTEYQFCSKTESDGGQTVYLWTLPPKDGNEWEKTDGAGDNCLMAKSPAMVEREGRIGDTLRLYVRPANFCYANGADTSRNGKYLYVFLRSVPAAPRVIDTIDRRAYNGYTKEQLETLVKNESGGAGGAGGAGGGMPGGGTGEDALPWPQSGVPYPLLLCNNTYFGLNVKPLGVEQAFLLHTPGNPLKHNDYEKKPEEESGFVVEFPTASSAVADALKSYYTIEPYKGRELSDTNLLVFRLDLAKRAALKDQMQIVLSIKAANECGPGDPRYFAINIIDTISVQGKGHHVHSGEDDLVYDTLSLCEGTQLNMANSVSTDGSYVLRADSSLRNTDKIEYCWKIPDSWRFDNPKIGPNANPVTSVWVGQEDGSVQLALRNRCGTGSFRSGDFINVNPYTRVNIKVVNGFTTLSMALDPKSTDPEIQQALKDNPLLLNPCRGSQNMYAGDTTERTDLYRWEFPSDWEVITGEISGQYNGTAEAVPDHPNWAYTRNQNITSKFKDMRVRVKVGADTGNIYVVGQTLDCRFEFDNYEPDLTVDPAWYGHRRDTLKAVVRPFTGKPMQDGAWPDSICVRKVVSLSVKADISQDSLTRNQTHFTWKFPDDYTDALFSSDDRNFPDKNTTLTFTVPDSVGRYDTIKVYSHRYDCDAYNQGDSMVVILKLTDTIPFVANTRVNDARRPEDRINLTPCEGDTVVYRLIPNTKRYLDSVWFTWNGGNAFEDASTGLIDETGWRVLNPLGRYADTLKMVVGRNPLELGYQAVSPCGMSAVSTTVFNPIALVRDTVHLVQGPEGVLCMNEKAVFEWDSVKYATSYEWFYPWGKKHDTLDIDKKMFYREFPRSTAFDTGYIFVRPKNSCGVGPYSDSVKISAAIKHLGVPSIVDFPLVRDTAYDTLCLRTDRLYQADYQDADYKDNSSWVYRWHAFSVNASDSLAFPAHGDPSDSSSARFFNKAGFETKYIGVSVRHRHCRLLGDTALIRILPADTVAIDDATLADRLSDWKLEDKAIMTKPCGTDEMEWHFNSVFGTDPVVYRFVWWDSLNETRARNYVKPGNTMSSTDYVWLNPKDESSLDDAWYKDDEDVLNMRVANNQTLFVSLDLKNRCGISHLPSLAIRTVTSIADSAYNLQMVPHISASPNTVCNGDSLVFQVETSPNIGGYIWHYPWGSKIDSVKVGTQTERSFLVDAYDTGYVYVTPYNGCGNARNSDSIHIAEVLAVPARAVPADFDYAYDYTADPVARDTLCMRTTQVLHVHSDTWEEGKFETNWKLLQGDVLGFSRAFDSCVLNQTDVNQPSFVIEFSSKAKGCKRYSDTLRIEIFPMDTLTFAMVEDPDEGLGRLEVLLPEIVQNYADGTPIDTKPCGGTPQKYTIKNNIHWSLLADESPYFSWNAPGEAPQDKPVDGYLGTTDWKYAGEPVEEAERLHDLPLTVGFEDVLHLHVNLHNLCGTSHSPALVLSPKPAVGQKPQINGRSICLDAKDVEFECGEVPNANEYHWEFPWPPYNRNTQEVILNVPQITDVNGNVIVYAVNDCGKGPADTLKAMVIHTPKAPVPAWRNGVYPMQNDTVCDTICLYGRAILKVKQDEQDAPGVRFSWVCEDGNENIRFTPSDTTCIIEPTASATAEKSALLAVYGWYAACGGEGEKRFIRIYFEDTLSSALVGNILVDPADLMTEPTPCPQEEIVLRVENNIAPVYKWTLPATWSFKESLDSTAASVTVVAGTARGRIGVKPLRTSAPLGCGSFNTSPRYSVEFIPRAVPSAPAFTGEFETYPCVGSTVTYRLANVQAGNIKAYRWEFPADWRVPGTDAAVVGAVGDTNVVPVTTDNFCVVIVGKDSGNVVAYAMDSCGDRLVRGNPVTKAVYTIDTAKLQVLGDQNVCLDSTVYLTVEFLNAYTKTSGYRLELEYVDSDDEPLVVEVENDDSTHLKIKCTNRDTVRMIFTPHNLFSCNEQPYVHYIITDTVPEIGGVIEGPSVVCVDNSYTYVFHVDPEKKAIFDDIEYAWKVPQGWHIESVEDTVLHVYFDSVPASMPEHDTIFCYPSAGCGTAFPTILVLSVQEPDAFNDSIETDNLQPCIGTQLNVWLRDADRYNTDTIRFVWNTPAGRDADWVRMDADSLPRTSYIVQYDTASYIRVRYMRDHGCGMSKPLVARIAVRDSAAKARLDASRYPCYTREFYELAVFPDKEHIDSVSWRMLNSLTATEHTREGSSIKNDSLSVANPDHITTAFSVGVRTFNECGSRDTVFTIRPITTISDFQSPLVAPRFCASDTAYAYIELTNAQQKQGLFFEWHFVPDSAALSLDEFVAGDTTAVLQFLSSAGNDSLRVVLRAGNDCSVLGDSMLSPRVVDIVPFAYRITSTYDETREVVYGFDSLRVEVDGVSVGSLNEYSYTWQPENRLYERGEAQQGAAWAYTRTLVQNPEMFFVASRQRRTAAQEALPFYRRDGLCYAYDTLAVRVDSLLRVLVEEEPLACVNAEYLLQIDLQGGNYDRSRVDTTAGINRYFHSIAWFRLQDDTLWQEIPEGRNQTSVTIAHSQAGNYLYRVIAADSTVLRDSATAAEPVLAAVHADTLDMTVGIYAAPEIHFSNVSSNPVEVAAGSRIEIDSRVEEGTGYYVYRWSSEPDTSLILLGYEDTENTRTRSIYQQARIILTVSDTLSGCRASDTVAVRIGKGNDIVNAFTPNGDGKNDVFLKGVSELSIFTRWGEQIFHTTEGEGWDGTHKGKKVRPGDYLYVAIVYENGEKLVFKGVVTVLKVD